MHSAASRPWASVAAGFGGPEVDLRGFGWRHSGRREPTLSDVTLHIPAGQRVLLLGASGAGKSTLLAAIAGVLGDEEDGDRAGRITVGGYAPEAHRGAVGMVLQDPDAQVISATVGDDVVFGCENLGVGREEMWQRAAEALALVGLDLPLDHPTHQLSGGQKQRLALAGVIAMHPGVIVLDEPTANLDPQGVEEVRRSVIDVAQHTGATLIVVEHRVDVWLEHMDRVVVLGQRGSIVADGEAKRTVHAHAEQLAHSGIWVPDVPLDIETFGGAASEKTVLTTSNLDIGWGREETPIQRGLNLRLQDGSTVLTGANGAGKSTLAMTLGGLLPPVSGAVDATGLLPNGTVGSRRVPTPDPSTWRSKELIRHIGYVFQNPEHQFAARTVRDELLLGPRRAGLDATESQSRADALLAQLGLERLAAASPYSLSGGEKRRLSVASMLTTSPRLLILDEPTFGQDRNTFMALLRLLQDVLADGRSVLSISHDPDYVRLMGQHTWRLS